jgi:hypothetical protein
MSIGKLKINNTGLFSSKWDFYEYARHSIRWSMEAIPSYMANVGDRPVLAGVPYIKSDNFFIQLLAAYTAAYWQYLYFAQIVPNDLLTDSMSELRRGIDEGVDAITIGPNKIEPYFIKLYHNFFKRYLRGIMDDFSNIDDVDPNTYNPDINGFTKAFMDDAKQLSVRANKVEIEEAASYALSQKITDIPLSVFEKLSNMSVQYLPPKKGFFD